MEIFDVHHHLTPAHGGQRHQDAGRIQKDYESRIAMMGENKIDFAAILASPGYEHPDGIKDTMEVNNTIASYQKLDPKRFPVAIGIVEPLHGKAALGELERIKHELHLDGVSWHNKLQRVSIDHSFMR